MRVLGFTSVHLPGQLSNPALWNRAPEGCRKGSSESLILSISHSSILSLTPSPSHILPSQCVQRAHIFSLPLPLPLPLRLSEAFSVAVLCVRSGPADGASSNGAPLLILSSSAWAARRSFFAASFSFCAFFRCFFWASNSSAASVKQANGEGPRSPTSAPRPQNATRSDALPDPTPAVPHCDGDSNSSATASAVKSHYDVTLWNGVIKPRARRRTFKIVLCVLGVSKQSVPVVLQVPGFLCQILLQHVLIKNNTNKSVKIRNITSKTAKISSLNSDGLDSGLRSTCGRIRWIGLGTGFHDTEGGTD